MSGQATITINGKQWSISVATTPAELQAGLGGLASIPAGSGMLFDLGGDQAVSVTTVPMLFNLDIVFISSSLQVVDVIRNVAPGQILTENTPVRFFMEVNAGETQGIAAGNSVSITGYTPAAAAAFDFGSIIEAFLPLLVMGFFAFIGNRVVSRMFEKPKERPGIPAGYKPISGAKPLLAPPKPTEGKAPTAVAPAKPSEAEELQQKKTTLENSGREIARQAGGGIEFLRLAKGWESEYATPRYWFKDAEGNEIIATDLTELKEKLSLIGSHHSSPLEGIPYQEPKSVADGLEDSMEEERMAADWYRRRAEYARTHGDEISAKLWEHIAGEEDGHYKEFKYRLEVLVGGVAHHSKGVSPDEDHNEEQTRKLIEFLGLKSDEVIKIHSETGYVQ